MCDITYSSRAFFSKEYRIEMSDRGRERGGMRGRGGGYGNRGRGGGRDSSSLAYANQSLNASDIRHQQETAERIAAIPATDKSLFQQYQTGIKICFYVRVSFSSAFFYTYFGLLSKNFHSKSILSKST